MKYSRIVFHWTAGRWDATEAEEEDYHGVVGFDEDKDKAFIEKETPPDLFKILPHAWKDNTGSYGISASSMGVPWANSTQWGNAVDKMIKNGLLRQDFNKYNFGSGYPVRWEQIEAMCQMAARVCKANNIEVTPETVYTHAESAVFFGYFPDRWDFWKFGDKMRVMTAWYLKQLK